MLSTVSILCAPAFSEFGRRIDSSWVDGGDPEAEILPAKKRFEAAPV